MSIKNQILITFTKNGSLKLFLSDFGIQSFFSFLHEKNKSWGRERLLEVIVTSARASQWEKHSCPIDDTNGGMAICVKELHPEKHLYPIVVTDDGIMICFN